MYEVFVNDRLFRLTAGPILLHSKTDMLKELRQGFFDLEKGLIPEFNLSGDLNILWPLFQSEFKLISAAGGWVENKDGQLLVIKRLGKWDLPKGKMEAEESKEESAIREVEEECGVSDLKIIKPLQDTYHTYRLKGSVVLKTTHWFKMSTNFNGALVPQLEEDIEQVRWMSREEYPELLANTYANISRLVQAQK